MTSAEHYRANHQGTGRKAQLAAPSKLIALQYKAFFDEFGKLESAVVISPPDTREGNESVDEATLPTLHLAACAACGPWWSRRHNLHALVKDGR